MRIVKVSREELAKMYPGEAMTLRQDAEKAAWDALDEHSKRYSSGDRDDAMFFADKFESFAKRFAERAIWKYIERPSQGPHDVAAAIEAAERDGE
jgi:hypothetical protein